MRIFGKVEVGEALKIILDDIRPLPCEDIKLTETLDRVLAENIYADINIPSLDISAIDGYAVRSVDTNGVSFDSPKVFEIIGELKTGDISSQNLEENQAIRIMVGANIPEGVDCVVGMEDIERGGKHISKKTYFKKNLTLIPLMVIFIIVMFPVMIISLSVNSSNK